MVTMLRNDSKPGLMLLRSTTNTPSNNISDWQSLMYFHPNNNSIDFPRINVNQNNVLVSFKLIDVGVVRPAFILTNKINFSDPVDLIVPTVSSDMEFLCPVTPAGTADFNKTDFYFLGMDKICTSGSNRIFLYHLVGNNAITEQILTGSILYYSNTNGINSNISTTSGGLFLFSNRPWAAVINNNTIHFVSHFIEDVSTYRSSIYYGIVNVNTNQLTSRSLGQSGEFQYFPSIAFVNEPSSSTAYVNFIAHNATTTMWKTSLIKGGNSNSFVISNYAGVISNNLNLGDYTAAQRQYNTQYVWLSGQLPTIQSLNGIQGYYVRLTDVIELRVKTFLQGPYASSTGLMNDDLRRNNLIPSAEPYTGMTGFTHIGGGGETITPSVLAVTGNNAIVDWVFIQLRDKNNASTVLATRAALLQRDGDIVDVDGTSPVTFNIISDNYFVAIRHRSHLGARTASPVAIPNTATSLDFTTAITPSLFYGTNPQKDLGSGKLGLYMGNVVQDGVLKYSGSSNDRLPILTKIGGSNIIAIVSGYFVEDCNMDGVVKYSGSSNDRLPILTNIGGTNITATVAEQL
jgi:hypothetical protein